ncbi:MAG: YceI family protein [Pseudonocardia sp.]|nr:YceI family protein [Pseudonocardia sp.]
MTTTVAELAAGTWAGDPVHSHIAFQVRHMGIGRVRGTVLTVGDDGLGSGSVTAVVDAATVHTGNDQRDQHVRSADFLDVQRYPTIELTSTGVRDLAGPTFTLLGDLTIHGVPRPVELASRFHGVVSDPSGAERTGFSAVTTISRAAFGVDIRLLFGAGQVVVADTVEISVDVEFVADGVG